VLTVALDVTGGDRAPRAPVQGAASAVGADEDLEVLLIGEPSRVRDVLASLDATSRARERLEVVEARDRIDPEEPPAMAVRRKPDSAIVKGLRMVAGGEADAFVSAGSTGAVMAGSLLELEALPGVDRPAIGAVFPTVDTPTLVLDVGANVNCRPRHLHQFAHLGLIYAREMLDRTSPRIGLLNVGEEAKKGDEVVAAAHDLLSDDGALNFVGNVEGNQIISGSCDVLVCDGFVGNALLKFFESMAEFVVGWLDSHGGGDDAPSGLWELLSVLDYAEYGGAPLLGVNGVSIVCHGSSSPRAIENALGFAARSVRSGMVEHLAREMERAAPTADEEPAHR